MNLEKINGPGIFDTYAFTAVQKEFEKAVSEKWKIHPPWERYQRKLMQDLAVLCEYKENAISFPQYEKLTDEADMYSIRHPKTKKNVRIIYTITANREIILITAFLEKSASDYDVAVERARGRMKEV